MACYLKNSGNVAIVTDAYSPCQSSEGGGHTQCCIEGDICMSDGLCQSTRIESPGWSGLYMGGCTDPEYRDEECSKACEGPDKPDSVYDLQTGEWIRCGVHGGLRVCNTPKGNTLKKPAHRTFSSAVASTAAGSTDTVPQVIIPTAAAAFHSAQPQQVSKRKNTSSPELRRTIERSRLSSGAYAGIGVSYAVLSLALIVLIVLLFNEKKRHAKSRRALRRYENHEDDDETLELNGPHAYSRVTEDGSDLPSLPKPPRPPKPLRPNDAVQPFLKPVMV